MHVEVVSNHMQPLQADRWVVDMLLQDKTLVSNSGPHDQDTDTPLVIRGYNVHERLSTTPFASVYRVVRDRENLIDAEPSIESAAKVYSDACTEEDFSKELHFLRAVQFHPNVMELCFFQERPTRAIVVPMYDCDVCEYVRRRERVRELDAAKLTLDLLRAVRHIHHRGVLHRNIKPDSIAVIENPRPTAVLVDLSHACHTWDNSAGQNSFGALGYVAPEVQLGLRFTQMADVYSVGCVLYFIVQQRSPFHTDPFDLDVSLRLSSLCQYELDERFEFVSGECKTFVASLLVRLPSSRLSAGKYLEHPWLVQAFQ
eukprot:TRINITY_DN41035_c0_g1_i1.p1 TRINITY_DN41035_c0_g1~~TRINITY_DN41035_c0_g1_i1.p1  ORF type:complete len:314 (+),score=41.73 TRINITY_DN41035_c0_g1_i1:36-977(+)